ncbi:hypothetical protein WJ0W_001483 [Paenibacillus melissococcoides]|uniref:Uncharacterized protein n=1 Tax=Paenibacillus melissococcoides TaxID=2912268 RepID=A0ABN8TZP1_9BACL|nr:MULTISPECIES: hypothetical protein [Paenibacillus]MEB9895346.1 hypothetical protein [Bacillus cereus]CAH8244245.1 hypothetical protein WJ0W_001483 [Paenibacillus melissococcoides]CAH8703587.1 hypothetical protein HTL2_000184 [Paenibacillus melissococcoides]CAH8706030.1 hypothetical protein WDD9_001145 [Paenibacillus melissococcoides]GIO82151.1 hypothetical protein J6TS7_57610 [Paenibacillus dendritiformis]
MSKEFLDAVKKRRSIYAISKDSVLSDEQLERLPGEKEFQPLDERLKVFK